MGFLATLTLVDAMNRNTSKELECEATVLATALTDIDDYLVDLATVSDLGLTKINYSEKDVADAYAATAGSNVDTGATFRLLLSDGNIIAYKIPGFKQSLADGGEKNTA